MACLQSQLRKIRHVALDMDGTIYLGDRLFPSTPAFLAQLQKLQIGYSFLTNNSSHSREDYVQKLRRMGLAITSDQVYTSTHATAEFLQAQFPTLRRLFVLGTPSMQQEMQSLGFTLADENTPPEAVVVGFDRTLQYDRLCQAAWWISRGLPFIATHPDRICPTNLPTVLVDCGSICAALEHATGRAPVVIGKPDPRMLAGLRLRLGFQPEQVAMVGDRLTTDMALARASNTLGILVLTGEATRPQAEASPWPPDLIVSDLAELSQLFRQAHADS